MKILLTGASSFTGLQIIKSLNEAGHEVHGTLTKDKSDYDGLRGERVNLLEDFCEVQTSLLFGEEKFIELIKKEKYDLIIHHAAVATDPRSPEFDWRSAVDANTNNIEGVFEAMRDVGTKHFITTGSLYEIHTSIGSEPKHAFNKYGLSKTLTWEIINYFAHSYGVRLGKVTLPIVFGFMETPKFVSYLAKMWLKGETPEVRTPLYIRDYLPVTLMGKAYANYVEEFYAGKVDNRFNPSYYIMSNGNFAKFVADKLSTRLNVDCPVGFQNQEEFPEDRIRVNNDPLDVDKLDWDEENAWNNIAEFYLRYYN